MKITFVDTDVSVARALEEEFRRFPEVTVLHGDLLKIAHNCVVSPANSYGFMDGGIDRDYATFFGPPLQQKIAAIIASRPEGYLPLGASTLISTGHSQIPFLILAPTMITPEFIPPDNVYRAMRAVLRLTVQHADDLKHLFSPALGTGVGGLSPEISAASMAEAYRDFIAAR